MAETADPQPPGRGKTVALTVLLTTLFWTVVWGGFALARGRPQPVAFAVQPPPATATPAPTATTAPLPTSTATLAVATAAPAATIAARGGVVIVDAVGDDPTSAAAADEQLAANAAAIPSALPARSAGEILVNINTATLVELESLPEIGPKTAEAIIAYREANGPFATIEALTEVKGIGPATLEKLRVLITVD